MFSRLLSLFKINRLKESLAFIPYLSLYFTGFQLLFPVIARAAMPSLPSQSQLAQKESICSFINANNVNIRTNPGNQYQVITRLNRGDVVRAVRRSDNWVEISGKVTSSPGRTPEIVKPLNGWVNNAFINGCSEDQFDRWRKSRN